MLFFLFLEIDRFFFRKGGTERSLLRSLWKIRFSLEEDQLLTLTVLWKSMNSALIISLCVPGKLSYDSPNWNPQPFFILANLITFLSLSPTKAFFNNIFSTILNSTIFVFHCRRRLMPRELLTSVVFFFFLLKNRKAVFPQGAALWLHPCCESLAQRRRWSHGQPCPSSLANCLSRIWLFNLFTRHLIQTDPDQLGAPWNQFAFDFKRALALPSSEYEKKTT